MPYPSVCPECGASVDITRQFPGGIDAPVTIDCTDCDYTEEFDEEPENP